MSKHYPPTYMSSQFNCIQCGVFAKQSWEVLRWGYNGNTKSGIHQSSCDHCHQVCYWYDSKMIIPTDSVIEPQHVEMPREITVEYNEARSIFGKSPRAAAALLRLAVQKLMPLLGQSGNNINHDIKALVADGLPVQVQQALDYCRVIGNNAVHPGEIDLSDTPEVALNLFNMVNFIVEDRIARPKHIKDLYSKLPQPARDAIAARDGKPSSGSDSASEVK